MMLTQRLITVEEDTRGVGLGDLILNPQTNPALPIIVLLSFPFPESLQAVAPLPPTPI